MKIVTRLCSLTAALLVAGMLSSPVSAITVNGSIPTGVWRMADSPVTVAGDIELQADNSLAIEAGVRVEFAGPYTFIVRGVLTANGTSNSKITFTSADGLPDSMRWKGIRFVAAKNGCNFNFVRIEKSWARGDWPLNSGGALYLERSNPSFVRSEIVDNWADADGGAVFAWFSNATFRNVLFHSNKAGNYGGALCFSQSSPTLVNCTVAMDTAGVWGGGVFSGAESRPVIINSIITHNFSQTVPGDPFIRDFGRTQSSSPSVSFSSIGIVPLTPFPGSGNIFLDPSYKSAVPPYDFHLNYWSPCVDGGDPKYGASAEPDILVNRIDMGAYGGTEEATPSVPVISVNFNALSYNSYRLNAAKPKEIKIQNRGHYRLFISDFQFSSPIFYTDSTKDDSGRSIPSYLAAPIEPGDQAKFTIYFRPAELRAYQESVTILSNDTLFESPTISLSGTGIDPIAELGDTLIFQRTAIGTRRVQSMWVHNRGRSNLTVSESGVQGESFLSNVINGSVAPGDSGEIRFTFLPERAESYSASAGFSTNDIGVYVTLLGRGFGPKLVLPDTSARFLGYVYVNGDTAISVVKVRNDGDENLVISSATVVDTVAFSTALPVDGLVIAPESTGDLVVKFHPQQPNQVRTTQMTITSNYPITQTLGLSGRGMAEPGHYVFGHVSGTWDWSAGHSDYIVLDSVYVPANERLKIEPGARILFEPGASFLADGEVRAIGTSDDSIYFLPRDRSGTEAARWKGISLSIVDDSRLSFCSIYSSRSGIKIKDASPRLRFCTISDNGDSTATADSTSLGGGINLENSGAVITGCVIENNFAAYGAGIYVLNSKPTIANCVVRNNQGIDGAALYLEFLTGGMYQNLLINGNTAFAGNGIFTSTKRSAPRVVNCTIADNSGTSLLVLSRSLPTIINSILWNNTQGADLRDGSNVLVSYSDFQGGVNGTQNLNVDPEFVGSGLTPYELSDGSPLIDKGNPEATFRDYYFPPSKSTPRNDLGVYGGPMGGGWGIPDITIGLFQNPAYPRWCDVVVAAENTFAEAPVCSVEFNVGTMNSVVLTQIDPTSYRGSFESQTDGTIFLTANGQLSGKQPQKIGRTYEVAFTDHSGESIYVVPFGGSITLPEDESARQSMVIITECDASIKPEESFLPVSSSVYISGLTRTGVLEIPVESFTASNGEMHLSLYRKDASGWVKLESFYSNGRLHAAIDHDGEYLVAFDGSGYQVVEAMPEDFSLLQAYPNPFNGGVTIAYNLEAASRIKLSIFDLSGRIVGTISDGVVKSGRHSAYWDAESKNGDPLPSGIYWARLETERDVRSTKLLLVR